MMAANAVAIRQASTDLITFDDKKRELIRKTIAKDLNQDEFDLFISIAQARGLDPVLNQIHAVKRKVGDGPAKMVIQVGIDGLRLNASRTSEYAGCDEITYEHNDKKEVTKAKATVYRMINGVRCAFVGVAMWDEFYPGDKQGFMWNKMPYNQLGKCAEAQALRKGFPGELGGMYAPEELEREVIDVTTKQNDSSPFEDDPKTLLIKDIVAKFAKLGVTVADIEKKYSLASMDLITDEQLEELKGIGSDLVNKRTIKAVAFP